MIPFYERFFSFLKKLPLVNVIKKTAVVKGLANKVRKRDLDKRRVLVSKNGYKIIESVFGISNTLGIELWIDWGTLLGYYREGKILEHDYDLDASTWRMDDELHSRFLNEMQIAGFELVRLFKLDDIIMTETFERDGVLIDFEYYWKEGNKAYTYNFDLDEKNSKLSQEKDKQIISGMNIYIFETECIEFTRGSFSNGTICSVPIDTEKKLCELYTENWRVPVKDFNWKDLHNYIEKGFFPNATGWRIR